MDDLEKYYGKQTFRLYGLFAEVPGKKVWPRKIFLILSISLLVWATVIQILKIVIERFKRQIIIELLPTTVAVVGCLVYVPYVAMSTKEEFKILLLAMINDLKDERTEEENAIKRQYYRNANTFVNFYSTLCVLAMCGMLLSGFTPYILDLLIPLNVTRGRQLLVCGEFLVDQEKYYYHLYLLECCCVFVLAIIIVGTENMSVIIGQHACSMVAVLGHRMQNLTHVEEGKVLDEIDYEHLVKIRLQRCIVGHQKGLQFAILIAAFYDIPLTVVLSATFCALTVSLVQVTNIQLINTTIALFTVVQVFQLYILSYMGQCGIDYAERIALDAYNADWWKIPPDERKILQLIILRASKPCLITARNMYTLSMQNFLSVMQTVISFYMVLR